MIMKNERQQNLEDLIYAIDNGSLDGIIKPTSDWGGANIIITSDKVKASNMDDGEDFFSRQSGDLYVMTKNCEILSGLFCYVRDKVMPEKDNYLYAFMALSAIDFIRKNDDGDYVPLLKHVAQNIKGYLTYYNWQNGMADGDEAFKVMRYYLSSKISDDEIRFIL